MDACVYVDGVFAAPMDARISVFDHGLLYGDGIFEGIRAYNGRVFKLDRHIERLFASAKAISLQIPHTRGEMAEIVMATCRENQIVDGYIRLVVTRGAGALGIDPRSCRAASVIVIAQPRLALYGDHATPGLKVITSTYRRVPPDTLSPSIKTCNYLNNIMARIEATARGADEALMLDVHGYVAEATVDNFFIVGQSGLTTPPTATNLPGITRETVLELAAKARIPSAERSFTQYDVWTAQEAFLCGTAAEIVPVIEVDGRAIGCGSPGPITTRLVAAYRELVRSTGTPIWPSADAQRTEPLVATSAPSADIQTPNVQIKKGALV